MYESSSISKISRFTITTFPCSMSFLITSALCMNVCVCAINNSVGVRVCHYTVIMENNTKQNSRFKKKCYFINAKTRDTGI